MPWRLVAMRGSEHAAHRVLAYPGLQIIGLVAATVFEIANRTGRTPIYDVVALSEGGG
jgi:hypothetical protein